MYRIISPAEYQVFQLIGPSLCSSLGKFTNVPYGRERSEKVQKAALLYEGCTNLYESVRVAIFDFFGLFFVYVGYLLNAKQTIHPDPILTSAV